MLRLLFSVLVLLLSACGDNQLQTTSESGVTVSQRMSSTPDPGFERAYQVRPFNFPQDHGAHPKFATEWWYFTGNLQSDEQRRYGYQLTLFRVGLKPGQAKDDSDWRTHQLYIGHLAVSDIENRKHISAERFARAAAGLAGAETFPLKVWLGPWTIQGTQQQLFPLRLQAETVDFGIDLTLQAGDKNPVLQGDRGLSQKGAEPGNASYYYSYTRLPSQGSIRIGNRMTQVSGNSWFDREWSSSALATDQAGWDWFALQLDDGRDLMFYRMRGKDGTAQGFSKGVMVEQDGSTKPLSLENTRLKELETWQSEQGYRYPIEWQLTVPSAGIDWKVKAAFEDQQMLHTVNYWEGAVDVGGSHQGMGYLELSGYSSSSRID